MSASSSCLPRLEGTPSVKFLIRFSLPFIIPNYTGKKRERKPERTFDSLQKYFRTYAASTARPNTGLNLSDVFLTKKEHGHRRHPVPPLVSVGKRPLSRAHLCHSILNDLRRHKPWRRRILIYPNPHWWKFKRHNQGSFQTKISPFSPL